jgi:hypothetical protein
MRSTKNQDTHTRKVVEGFQLGYGLSTVEYIPLVLVIFKEHVQHDFANYKRKASTPKHGRSSGYPPDVSRHRVVQGRDREAAGAGWGLGRVACGSGGAGLRGSWGCLGRRRERSGDVSQFRRRGRFSRAGSSGGERKQFKRSRLLVLLVVSEPSTLMQTEACATRRLLTLRTSIYV